MKNKLKKSWVIVKFNNETKPKVWRDYGTAWGSPAYTVLGYFDGTHKEARREARLLIQTTNN